MRLKMSAKHALFLRLYEMQIINYLTSVFLKLRFYFKVQNCALIERKTALILNTLNSFVLTHNHLRSFALTCVLHFKARNQN